MNFFTKLFRSRDKPKNYLSGRLSFLFGQTSAGYAVNERSAMQVTAVYACVRILAEAIAGLPLGVYRYTENGSKEKVPDHPLYALLHDEPNPEMTSFIFRETMMSHLLLWGNAYAQIIRDGRGQVLGLYPLLPSKMDVSRADNGELVYTYSRGMDEYGSKKRTEQVELRREDVLHIPDILAKLPGGVVLKDFDVLFNPDYKVDVLKIMINTCKAKPFSIIWPGFFDGNRLVYAEEGFQDYKTYDVDDYDITCIV